MIGWDPAQGDAEVTREGYLAALSWMAAGLAGDAEAAKVIYQNTVPQLLLVAMAGITATVLEDAGIDPAAWVADQQAGYRDQLAGGM